MHPPRLAGAVFFAVEHHALPDGEIHLPGAENLNQGLGRHGLRRRIALRLQNKCGFLGAGVKLNGERGIGSSSAGYGRIENAKINRIGPLDFLGGKLTNEFLGYAQYYIQFRQIVFAGFSVLARGIGMEA